MLPRGSELPRILRLQPLDADQLHKSLEAPRPPFPHPVAQSLSSAALEFASPLISQISDLRFFSSFRHPLVGALLAAPLKPS
jgi:hypothetical protein